MFSGCPHYRRRGFYLPTIDAQYMKFTAHFRYLVSDEIYTNFSEAYNNTSELHNLGWSIENTLEGDRYYFRAHTKAWYIPMHAIIRIHLKSVIVHKVAILSNCCITNNYKSSSRYMQTHFIDYNIIVIVLREYTISSTQRSNEVSLHHIPVPVYSVNLAR